MYILPHYEHLQDNYLRNLWQISNPNSSILCQNDLTDEALQFMNQGTLKSKEQSYAMSISRERTHFKVPDVDVCMNSLKWVSWPKKGTKKCSYCYKQWTYSALDFLCIMPSQSDISAISTCVQVQNLLLFTETWVQIGGARSNKVKIEI